MEFDEFKFSNLIQALSVVILPTLSLIVVLYFISFVIKSLRKKKDSTLS